MKPYIVSGLFHKRGLLEAVGVVVALSITLPGRRGAAAAAAGLWQAPR